MITSTQGVQIFEITTLRFCVQQSHWIKSTLIVQKMLKLSLPEMIKVLLPTQHTINFPVVWLDNSVYQITK